MPAGLLGAFALLVFGRLVQLQVLQHDRYAELANQELISDNTIYAARGSILDRNGNVLAASVDTWDVYVSTRAWKDPAKAGVAAKALAKALNTDVAAIQAKVTGRTGDVIITRDLEYEAGKSLATLNLDGVVLMPNTARVYPEGDLAASVLGFIGQDNTGLAGIEAAENDILQGKPGKAVYERDTVGEPIPLGRYVVDQPQAGRDVVLTIDRYLQQLAEERLAQGMKEHNARGGSITIMDPMTGEILASASQPSFSYSTLDLSDPKQTEFFKNASVANMYEPGSVMKIVTAAAAIDQGLVTPDTTYVDTGVASIYGIELRNWSGEVWGKQTMTGVLQHSINTGAVFMVEKLGQEKFHRYLDAFGFGKPTGIELQGEATGVIRTPDKNWDPPWSPVDLATQAFGQSISVTPIQMISAIAAAINGGNLMRPHLVKATIAADGTRNEIQPEIVDRAISEATSATIRKMMNAVVDPVGGYNPGKPQEYTAGGKSGTANVAIPNGYDDTQIASFVGFAPLDNPRILVLVKLDENQDFLTGTQAAGPIFSKLADDSLHYLNVLPDAPKRVSR
ncbi:MAG: penicillin-binding protein 2 [Chloroflexi bacterium]|nr:penicillin-binding protein 2 [Chloroflexota bacterium]